MDLKNKIILVIFLSILLIFTFCIISNADSGPDVLENPSSYNLKDENIDSRVSDKISTILTVVTNVGIVLSVLMSAILGVKYMLGSVEEKAEYKESLFPYFIGVLVLFGTCTFVKIAYGIGQKINTI